MPQTILVVDDDPQICRLVELNLTRAGYAVTTASDGEEALAKIAEARPDLVVLDVMMPRMDGFEALRRIKSDPGLADLRVLMLTAKAQDADIFRGWQMGADCYLTKPFNPMELLTFVKRIFDSLAPAGQEAGRIRL